MKAIAGSFPQWSGLYLTLSHSLHTPGQTCFQYCFHNVRTLSRLCCWRILLLHLSRHELRQFLKGIRYLFLPLAFWHFLHRDSAVRVCPLPVLACLEPDLCIIQLISLDSMRLCLRLNLLLSSQLFDLLTLTLSFEASVSFPYYTW